MSPCIKIPHFLTLATECSREGQNGVLPRLTSGASALSSGPFREGKTVEGM